MSLAAEIDENGIVLRVIVIDSPEKAQQLLGGTWVETTNDDPENKNGASIGYKYYNDKKNFSEPIPLDYLGVECTSFVLDEKCRWKNLVPKPTETEDWVWNEKKQEWVNQNEQ